MRGLSGDEQYSSQREDVSVAAKNRGSSKRIGRASQMRIGLCTYGKFATLRRTIVSFHRGGTISLAFVVHHGRIGYGRGAERITSRCRTIEATKLSARNGFAQVSSRVRWAKTLVWV